MSRDTLDAPDRDVALRRLLVAQATRTPRSVPWPALVGSVAVVAVLAGVALGATVFRPQVAPLPGETPSEPDLPAFISDDSTLVGTPMTIRTSETVAYEAGGPPPEATGLAVWVDCPQGGAFTSEVDGRPELGGDCFGTGGGYVRFAPYGPNVVRVTPDRGPATVTVAWIHRGDDVIAGARAEAALADGVVTEEEYRAAFERYVACMAEWGVTVDRGYEVDGVIYSTYPGNGADGAFHECYGTEFDDIDLLWQSSLLE